MSTGLTEKDISRIRAEFRAIPDIESVVLFGSRAKGNFREGSDIDLAISGAGLDLTSLNYLSMQLDNLNLPYLFDLVLMQHIGSAALLEHINRVGVLLYQRDGSK
ncbi:MAG: nucleotidyltransferase domain-containing protein [Chitinophagia bacterium]|nr:nucleotidyltransferase domain-containing protein [Chitinophagia bacterium]